LNSNQDSGYGSQTGKTLCQVIAEGAVLWGYATNNEQEYTNFEICLV